MSAKVKEINIPIFRGVLVVILSDLNEEVENITGKEHDGHFVYAECVKTVWDVSYDGDEVTHRDAYCVILNNKFKGGVKIHDIAHECLHVTHMILQDTGVTPDFNNDEVECYLMGWIFEQVYDFYKENTK